MNHLYKYGAIVLIVSLAGWWTYNYIWEAGYDQKTLEVEAAYAKQARQTILKEKENDKITQDVANAHAAQLNRLRHALSTRPMPSTADSAKMPDGTEQEYGSTCTRTFYSNALEDVIKLQVWQNWAEKQGIPVQQ